MAALGAKAMVVNGVFLVRTHCEVYERRGAACRLPWRGGGRGDGWKPRDLHGVEWQQ